MTFGRPPLISNNLMCCGFPSDADLEQWQDSDDMQNAASNARKPSTMAFFTETSYEVPLSKSELLSSAHNHRRKLNFVVGEVISKIYQDNVKHEPDLPCTELLRETIKMEKRLMEWKRALPSQVRLVSLQEIDVTSNDHQSHRFRIVLTLRYLNARALLHRGVVTQFLRVSAGVTSIDDPELSLLRTYGINNLECCSETVMNSIGIICRVASNESLLPVWWVSIYYGRLL